MKNNGDRITANLLAQIVANADTTNTLLNLALTKIEQMEAQLERMRQQLDQTANEPLQPIGDKHAAAAVLNVHPDTIGTYRRRSPQEWEQSRKFPWMEGVHYFLGSGRTGKVTYNLALLRDWRANKLNHRDHQKVISQWLKSQSTSVK
jgi:hypothetical protein